MFFGAVAVAEGQFLLHCMHDSVRKRTYIVHVVFHAPESLSTQILKIHVYKILVFTYASIDILENQSTKWIFKMWIIIHILINEVQMYGLSSLH